MLSSDLRYNVFRFTNCIHGCKIIEKAKKFFFAFLTGPSAVASAVLLILLQRKSRNAKLNRGSKFSVGSYTHEDCVKQTGQASLPILAILLYDKSNRCKLLKLSKPDITVIWPVNSRLGYGGAATKRHYILDSSTERAPSSLCIYSDSRSTRYLRITK